MTPRQEVAFSRLTNSGPKVLEALEDLDPKRLTPRQAVRLLDLLREIHAEASAAIPVLERVASRPERRGLLRRQANHAPGISTAL